MVTEDLGYLLISGQPNILELQDAFERIIGEFSSLVQNDKSEAIIKISKRIGLLQWQITYIDYIVGSDEVIGALQVKHVPELCTELRKLGYDYKFDPTNRYQYERDLLAVRSRAKSLISQRSNLLQEYKRMTATNGTGKRKTREDFEEELISLSRFQGYHIDKATTMTSSYAMLMTQYNKSAQAAKKAEKNGSR